MSQLNREVKTDHKNSYIHNKKSTENLTFFNSAIYLLIATTALATYMIWHYSSYGQWAMDGVMQSFIKSIRMPWLTALFRGITATGETVPVILATLILMISLMIYKKRKEALIFGFYMLGTWRLNDFLKEYLQRPRPDISLHLVETSGYSLPSGHSMNFMALVLLSLYFTWIFSTNKKLNRRMTILVLTYGFLVGISRIYLNVHYFSDVITGWSIGVACTAAAVIFHSFLCKAKAMQ